MELATTRNQVLLLEAFQGELQLYQAGLSLKGRETVKTFPRK
jgi:hypothetical protein